MKYWNNEGGKTNTASFAKPLVTPSKSAPIRKKKKRKKKLAGTSLRLKRLIVARQRELDSWLQQNVQEVDKEALVKLHQETAAKSRNRLLRIAARSLGTLEGVQNANIAIKQDLGMAEAGFNFEEIARVAADLVRMEVLRTLLSNSKLPPSQKEAIVKRYLARLFPLKDNLADNSGLIRQVQDQLGRIRSSVEAGSDT